MDICEFMQKYKIIMLSFLLLSPPLACSISDNISTPKSHAALFLILIGLRCLLLLALLLCLRSIPTLFVPSRIMGVLGLRGLLVAHLGWISNSSIRSLQHLLAYSRRSCWMVSFQSSRRILYNSLPSRQWWSWYHLECLTRQK